MTNHRAGLDQAGVVRAAAALADSVGLEAVTVARLAAQLGVRAPTLYHYVDGLPGLHRELALLGDRGLAEAMGRAVQGRAGEDALAALALAYRAFIKEHPGLYAATVRAAAPEDAPLRAAQTEVVEIVLRALAAYHLAEADALHTVRILRSLVHGFASLEVSGGFGLPLEVDESFRRLLQMFLRALRSPEAG
jgi:AcrR family transcriptional regulator